MLSIDKQINEVNAVAWCSCYWPKYTQDKLPTCDFLPAKFRMIQPRSVGMRCIEIDLGTRDQAGLPRYFDKNCCQANAAEIVKNSGA